MNSRDLGADLVLAWPEAELGIMAARAAVGIVNRRELRAAPTTPRPSARGWPRPTPRSTCAPTRRAAAGFVDEIIEPAQTRDRLAVGAASRFARRSEPERAPVILDGKRLLITGVITKDSIAFHAAEQAQHEGAEVVLTSFGRVKRMTERAAAAAADAGRRARARRQPARGSRRRWPSRCASAGARSTGSCTRSRSLPRTRSAGSS